MIQVQLTYFRDQILRPMREKVFQSEEGNILLFYHKPSIFTVPALYLKYLVPFATVIYLIKKNPFYKKMPVALPIMFIIAVSLFIRIVKFSAKTNVLISQIWMDRSCSQLTFVFMNARWRSMTGQETFERRLIQQMRNPPQGDQYRLLPGPLFPEEYPFRYAQIFQYGYFWRKYFISQRLYYCIPKRPMYVNYEILTNCFKGNLVNLQDTKLHTIPHDCSKPTKELCSYLTEQNLYTKEKFKQRLQKLKKIQAEKQKIKLDEKKVNLEVEKMKETLRPESVGKEKREVETQSQELQKTKVKEKKGWLGRIFQKLKKT